MNNIIIGTAGHVDHGKTCLINALTGINTDRLEEEKRRGITIELGFAYLDLPDGQKAGIIDVPGHEKFIRNMLAGAGGIDLALLVVAADEGVMPQTKEHLGILSLLEIQRGCVALTKIDLVEPEWLEMVTEDLREQLKGTCLEGTPILPVSSYTGEGMDALRKTLIELVEQTRGKHTERPFRLPADRVFSMQGFGTVITGTLIEGTLSVGEEVMIYPAQRLAKARGLQVHSKSVETALAGQRVAVNLQGVKREELDRGDVLAKPGSLQPTMMVDVRLRVLPQCERTIKNGSRLHFYCGAKELLCKAVLLGGVEELLPGDSSYAQLRFEESIALKSGDHFVVRFYSPIETVGGGTVLDPKPHKHRPGDMELPAILDMMRQGDAKTQVEALVREQSPRYTPLSQIRLQTTLSETDFFACIKELEEAGALLPVTDKLDVHAAHYAFLQEKTKGLLAGFHKANPLKAGMRREALRTSLFPRLETGPADRILDRMITDGTQCAAGRCLALPTFGVLFTPEQEALKEKLLAASNHEPFAPPERSKLMTEMGRSKDFQKVLDYLTHEGELVPLEPDLLFSRAAMDEAERLLRELAAQNGEVTLAQFRDAIGTSRKYAMALLEYWDVTGITRKNGDARVLRS
ncbi:MAG: selenocysteine-specific translation elongation factor [Clostridia bacterium]|nr:selenocysteine-specific translation elongation factor [Clostridia bacterium]